MAKTSATTPPDVPTPPRKGGRPKNTGDLDPVRHRKKLMAEYDTMMKVFAEGMKDKDKAISIPCAKIWKDMLVGRASTAPTPPDPDKNKVLVFTPLPNVLEAPTRGEVLDAEEDIDEDDGVDAEDLDDDAE